MSKSNILKISTKYQAKVDSRKFFDLIFTFRELIIPTTIFEKNVLLRIKL